MSDLYFRPEKMDATTDAVSWTIPIKNDTELKRINIVADAAPTTTEDLVITYVSANGAAYNCEIMRKSNQGSIYDFSITNIKGLDGATALLVEYPNTDGNSIRAEAIFDRVDE